MILVDTSVWVDHFRVTDLALARLLNRADVLGHRFVIGEIALGTLRQRDLVLAYLLDLSQADLAENDEVLRFITHARLDGTGIGYVDAHLLCSTKLTANARLWTRDKRLRAAARRLSIGLVEQVSSN